MKRNTIIKKISIVLMLIFIVIICPNSLANTEEQDQLLITSTTSLIDDLDLLEIDYESYLNKKTTDNEKMLAIFKDQEEVFIYMYQADIVATDYAFTGITINDVEYIPTLCNEILLGTNNLKKFKIKYYFDLAQNTFQFTVTNYKYLHLLKAEFLNHNTLENHFFGYDDENYYYQAQYENTVEVQGRLFSYKIDVETTVKDFFTDYWYTITNNATEKERLVYYMAINFWDKEKNAYFTPDSITSISLKYLEQQVKETWTDYVYYYDDSELKQNFNQTKSGDVIKEQTITPKDVKIDYSNLLEKVFSALITNGKMKVSYSYSTISKINQSSLSNELYQLVNGYDYVVSGLGNEQGYGYIEKLKTTILYTPSNNDYGVKYDHTLNYTQISNINVFNVSYWYKGNHYQINCDSLFGEKNDVDPTNPGTGDYDKGVDIWNKILELLKDLEKFMNFLIKNLWIVLIVVVVIIIVIIMASKFVGFTLRGICSAIWRFIKFIIKLPFKALSWIFNFLFK